LAHTYQRLAAQGGWVLAVLALAELAITAQVLTISADITEQMAEPAQHRAHQAEQSRGLLPLELVVEEVHLLGYMTLRPNNQTHRVA